MFHEQGYRAVSIRDLAAAVGVKMSSLYYYFSSKQDILYRIIKSHLDRLLAQTYEVIENHGPNPPSAELLHALIESSVLFLIEDRQAAGVSLLQTRELTGDQSAELTDLTSEFERIFLDLTAKGMASGEFVKQDAAMAAYIILGALTRVSIWFHPEGRLTPAEVAASYAELLTRLLAADR